MRTSLSGNVGFIVDRIFFQGNTNQFLISSSWDPLDYHFLKNLNFNIIKFYLQINIVKLFLHSITFEKD